MDEIMNGRPPSSAISRLTAGNAGVSVSHSDVFRSDSGEVLRELCQICVRYALREGLSTEEAEDCASAFVLHALEKPASLQPPDGLADATLWRNRCARNFARNYADMLRREKAHDEPRPRAASGEGDGDAADPADGAMGPESRLLLTELRTALDEAIDGLPEDDRTIFIRHHVEGESNKTLAAEYGITVGAMQQRLFRIRRHLVKQLAGQGLAEIECEEYMASISRGGG